MLLAHTTASTKKMLECLAQVSDYILFVLFKITLE